MIAKNLKVGDTFTECGRVYEITKVFPTCYESKFIRFEKEAVKEPVKEEIPFYFEEEEKVEIPQKKNYSKTAINRLAKEDLEKLCHEIGVEPGTGAEMKKAIIEKLGL